MQELHSWQSRDFLNGLWKLLSDRIFNLRNYIWLGFNEQSLSKPLSLRRREKSNSFLHNWIFYNCLRQWICLKIEIIILFQQMKLFALPNNFLNHVVNYIFTWLFITTPHINTGKPRCNRPLYILDPYLRFFFEAPWFLYLTRIVGKKKGRENKKDLIYENEISNIS